MSSVKGQWKNILIFWFVFVLLTSLSPFQQEQNLFQADITRIVLYAMIAYVFQNSMQPELLFARTPTFHVFTRHLLRTFAISQVLTIIVISVGMVFISYVRLGAISWSSVPLFLIFVQLNSLVLYLLLQLSTLTKHENPLLFLLWSTLVLFALLPKSIFNIFSFHTILLGRDDSTILFYSPLTYLILFALIFWALRRRIVAGRASWCKTCGLETVRRYRFSIFNRSALPAIISLVFLFAGTSMRWYSIKGKLPLAQMLEELLMLPTFDDFGNYTFSLYNMLVFTLLTLLYLWDIILSSQESRSYQMLIVSRISIRKQYSLWLHKQAWRFAGRSLTRLFLLFSLVQLAFVSILPFESGITMLTILALASLILRFLLFGVSVYIWNALWQQRPEVGIISALFTVVVVNSISAMSASFTGIRLSYSLPHNITAIGVTIFLYMLVLALMNKQIKNRDII